MSRYSATVIYNPFETQAEPPNRAGSRAALVEVTGIDPGHHIVGCVGRLHHEKRPGILVPIIARAARHLGAPVHAVFLGKDEGQRDVVMQNAVEQGVADRVHFLGFRYPPQAWIAGMDVIVAPRANEAFGRAIVEAMLVGTPVIAANRVGHAEILRDLETGILVEPDDLTAFNNAAIWLLSSPEDRDRIAKAAMADAKARFSVEQHVAQVQAIYEKLTK